VSWQLGRPRREPAGASTTEHAATPLDGLLEDMRELRLTLAADLSAAAGAAESGSPDIATDIVEADRRELARFVVAARDNLRALNRERQARAARRRRRWLTALPAIPIAGAVAVSAAAATGVLQLPHSGATSAGQGGVVAQGVATDQVPSSMRHFAAVVSSHPSASAVIAAASRLHRHLQALIASSDDPGRVAEAQHLLNLETALLLSKQPPGMNLVLSMTRDIAAQLGVSLSNTPVPTPIALEPSPADTPGVPRHHHASTTTTTTQDSPTPKPTKSSPDSPSPSSSPSSNPAPTLPSLPN
jgi:hypothetical protein